MVLLPNLHSKFILEHSVYVFFQVIELIAFLLVFIFQQKEDTRTNTRNITIEIQRRISLRQRMKDPVSILFLIHKNIRLTYTFQKKA